MAILLVTRLIARNIRRIFSRAQKRLSSIDETVMPILTLGLTYSTYLLGVVIALDVIGVNTTSIIALLGAAGLAIGLALRDTLSHFAAGIMLVLLRPIRVGEYVEFAGLSGTVREIGIFTTRLEAPDGVFVSAPNSQVWDSSIVNHSRNTLRRIDLSVGIAYSDRIDTAYEALRALAEKDERFLKEPWPPQFMVPALGDSSVTVQLRVWVRNADYWDIYWSYNKRLKEAMENAGLTIPFPQLDLHVIGDVPPPPTPDPAPAAKGASDHPLQPIRHQREASDDGP